MIEQAVALLESMLGATVIATEPLTDAADPEDLEDFS